LDFNYAPHVTCNWHASLNFCAEVLLAVSTTETHLIHIDHWQLSARIIIIKYENEKKENWIY